ncbi:MAG TPA: AAA family ATPase [Gemmataceae bacterium]
MQRIAIVDPSESSRESLRSLLLGVDFVWLEAECARYEYFYDVIQQSMPDLVIVSLDADRAKALQMITQLAVEYPKLPVLTVSSDHQALLQSLRSGARYFLTYPLGLEDLLMTLRRVLNESGLHQVGPAGAGSQPSLVTAVLGSRGGVGCTSLAVNLAATLAAEPANSVALIDLDLALGDADIALELNGTENISIADLARNIERLDMNFLRRALVTHPGTNLSVLRHPLEMHEIGVIHEGHVERILNLLKISYNYLVLDLSKGLLPTDLLALRIADIILLVGQLELSSLRNVVRLLHTLTLEDNLAEKVQVVINRVGSDHGDEGISMQKAEEVIGRPIFWQLPNDAKPMLSARVAGSPLLLHAPRCRAQQSIAGLAATLMGKPVAAADAAPKKRRGWFG